MTRPGEIVTARRESLKLSQREAARRASISPPAWGDVERDVREPSARTQRGVSEALGWQVDWYDRLVAGDDPVEINGPTLARHTASGSGHVTPPDAGLEGRVAQLEQDLAVVRSLVVTAVDAWHEERSALAAAVENLQRRESGD